MKSRRYPWTAIPRCNRPSLASQPSIPSFDWLVVETTYAVLHKAPKLSGVRACELINLSLRERSRAIERVRANDHIISVVRPHRLVPRHLSRRERFSPL